MKRPIRLLLAAVLLSLSLWAQPRHYALVLEDQPLAKHASSRKELRTQAVVDAGARIEDAQRALRQELAGRKVQVVGSVKTLLNAVFVQAQDESNLQGLPGVRRVAEMKRFKRHLDKALPLIKTQEAWAALSTAGKPDAGADIQIAIIDTGIDQNHPAFQDSSLPKIGPFCDNDCAFTNNKVIAARSYVGMVAAGWGSDPASNSRPDDISARDRVGHGTAAAMVAAGVANTGPLASISGIAPKAYLGNYKIFGSPGVNDGTYGDALIAALEDALNDGMNIASLSLGFPAWYGPYDSYDACGESICDVEALAVEAAVSMGMMVVVSAGNDGDYGLKTPTLNTIHTPGTAPSVITVGASRNGHVIYSSFGLTGADAPGNLASVRASFGDGPRTKVTAPLRDVGGDGLACSSLGSGSLSGAIALIQRGACDFWTKVTNAQVAGAVGVVVYREDGSGSGGDLPFPPGGLAGTGIPAAMIGNTNGRALKTWLQTHSGAEGVLDPAFKTFSDPDVNTMAAFSSRGPSIDGAIKPDVVAIGTAVYTATQKYDTNSEMYDASGYTLADGTSFSAPMVAGVLALVKQKNPGFSATQLKSAIVNTASQDITEDGVPARVVAVGAGKVNAEAAVKTNVTLDGLAGDPVSLSFGVLTSGSPTPIRFQVRNTSASPLTLAVQATNPTTAQVDVTPKTVAAGGTSTVTATLSGTRPGPGIYEGAITIAGGAAPLRVPYMFIVGDGIPNNVFPVYNGEFSGVAGDAVSNKLVGFKAVDQYGAAVALAPVEWNSTVGGAKLSMFDDITDRYGLAFARVISRPNPGSQEVTATVGSSQKVTQTFYGIARYAPTISTGGVINAASGQAPAEGQGLAPGSYISIWGYNLGNAALDWGAVRPANIDPYLPIALGGVTVSFDVPDKVSVPGRLTYVSDRQLNVQIPWELAGNPAVKMKVATGDYTTAVYTLFLSDAAPAVFEAPLGSGLAAAQDALTYQNISAQNPAKKDSWVVIYANGLGPVEDGKTPSTGETTPPGEARCRYKPSVTIDGKAAEVYFAGLVPTGIGYYQINVKVPADAQSGNRPVTVNVNGAMAKTVNLPIQ